MFQLAKTTVNGTSILSDDRDMLQCDHMKWAIFWASTTGDWGKRSLAGDIMPQIL